MIAIAVLLAQGFLPYSSPTCRLINNQNKMFSLQLRGVDYWGNKPEWAKDSWQCWGSLSMEWEESITHYPTEAEGG